MDGINSVDFIGGARPALPEAPRPTGCIYAILLIAVIIAATLVTLLALDYAGIHLPTGSEQLTWPPLG